jgi:NAD(P)-dependent dehydrogenase (short-subunit alcohol dehydrogenase family)
MRASSGVAVVTGGASGIGRACAGLLADRGFEIAVVDLASCEESMQDVAAAGRRGVCIVADVTDASSTTEAIQSVERELGGLDVLVTCAGGASHAGDLDKASASPPGRLGAVVDLNLLGTIYPCQAAARVMQRAGSGRIVTIASQAGLWSGRDGGGMPYKVAKAGVVHFTRVLAAEMGPFGIRVNSVAPGFISTARTQPYWDEAGSALTDQIPLRRIGSPEDVARAVGFLVGDDATYVTGQCLSVCGGYVAW